MVEGYSIKAFTKNEFFLMKELFESAYEKTLDKLSFDNKYATEKLGLPVIGFMAIQDETNIAAAFYGVFPVKLLINGKEVLAAQSGDTMTHKDHQKKGLFVQLAKITFEKCREEGIEIIFGLPNVNSYHGFTDRLKWEKLDEIERFDLKISLKTLPLPKVLQKLGLIRWYNRYAKRLLKKYIVPTPTDFTNSLSTDYGKVMRNAAYLDYKNEGNKFFLRINEVVLWIKLNDVLWIGDVNAYDKMDRGVISKLEQLAFKLGYNTIIFQINKSIRKPEFLSSFKKHDDEPLCFYYLNPELGNTNLLLTGADFDTW